MSAESAPHNPAADLLAEFRHLDEERYFNRLAAAFFQHMDQQDAQAALAILASEPELARRLPARAGHSAAHWACASLALAPVLEALLALGACPLGRELRGEAPLLPLGCSQTPMEWAICSGNDQAVAALALAGAPACPSNLLLACLAGQGGCALALLNACETSALAPFDALERPAGDMGPPLSAWEALNESIDRGLEFTPKRRGELLAAKARLEALWLDTSCLTPPRLSLESAPASCWI